MHDRWGFICKQIAPLHCSLSTYHQTAEEPSLCRNLCIMDRRGRRSLQFFEKEPNAIPFLLFWCRYLWMRSRVYVARPSRLFFHSKIIQIFSIIILICQNSFRQNAQQQKSPQNRPAFLLKSPRPKGYDKGMTIPAPYIM